MLYIRLQSEQLPSAKQTVWVIFYVRMFSEWLSNHNSIE